MNGLADFVAGGFPLPWNPVFADSGIGDFVWGGFPLPQNPVGYRPSVNGSLPKAPDIPMALIGHGNGAELDDCGDGMGCCSGCSGGMGAFDLASIQNLIPGQTFGISNTYLVGGALVTFLILQLLEGRLRRKERRRR